MNTTSIFIQQSSNFQFLSVCHYITIFGLYFYNKDLITLEERNKSISVLNTLFDYLNKSQNESEAKLQLLKKVLKGSDLYGGGENESLDIKYVDETYQYIISEALFSHYGNINGYLAKIINMADDINYSVLKEKVFQHLSENYTNREYCSNDIPLDNYDSDNNPLGNFGSKNNPLGNYGSNNISSGNYGFNNISSGNYSSKLNELTIQKVFDDHIWRIFPQPEQDMSIMEVNYIYAMVGLKIIRSVSSTSPNLTFHEYILISRELDLQDLNNETYEMIKILFSTPALFFYAYNQKAKFQKIDDFTNGEFWAKVYKNFFSYINSAMEKIVQENIENSLHNKIQLKMNKLKTRTFIAYELLFLICDYENIAQVSPIHVEFYKTFYLWITKFFLPKRCDKVNLPDLQKRYEYQFKEIEELYNKIERIAIEKVLVDSELIEKINLNSTVMFARVPDYQQGCNLCSPIPRKENDDIFLLFAVKEEKTEFYALRQENNTLSLLINKGNEREFAKAIANDSSLKMEIAVFSKTLKSRNEDYRSFIARVADIKTKLFVDNLKMHYYEETEGEKLLNFAKALIPFYSCIESAKAGRMAESAFSCSMDVLSLIPFAGWATEYTVKITNSLAVEIGNKYLITNTIARSGIISTLPISAVLNEISTIAVRTIAQEILTKSFLTDLTVASLRTIDPGFESVYQILRFGLKGLRKLFQSIVSNFKKIPSFRNMVVSINSLLENININLLIDHTVPLVLSNQNDFNIVRYFYPGGRHFFGPTCLTSFGNTAELRSIEGYSFPIPVVQEKSPDGILYKQYIPETDKFSDFTFKKGADDILRRVGYLIDTMVLEGRDINIIRDYHVYHNTIQLSKTAQKTEGLVQNPVTARESIVENNLEFSNPNNFQENTINPQLNTAVNNPFLNSEFQINLRGNVEGHNFPQVTNIEFIGTLRGHIAGYNFPQIPKSELPSTSKGIIKTEFGSDFSNVVQEAPKFKLLPDDMNLKKSTAMDYSYQIVNPDAVNTVKNDNFVSYTHKKFDGIISGRKRKLNEISETPEILLKNQKIDENTQNEKIRDEINNKIDVSTEFKKLPTEINPMYYKFNIREPTYSRYVDILWMLKNDGLSSIKLNKEKFNFLRIAVNQLALFQLNNGIKLQKRIKLWLTKIVVGQQNIDYLKNLNGRKFFFNDITLFSNKAPGPVRKNLKFYSLETEVRYHLTVESSYGFVDLTKFHDKFQNNYLTFNDLFFTVSDTFFTANNRILNIELKCDGVLKNTWRLLREQEIRNIINEPNILESSRMKSISIAANFMTDNAPLCTFKASRKFLANYILDTKSIGNRVPSYDKLAEDIKNMELRYFYNNWRIKENRYIQDVLFNYNLDNIIELSEAKRRIHDLYDLVYYQNIQEAFENYQKIPNYEQKFRFEDYYVLYSHFNNKLITNKDGIRRLEVAINRLALRQSADESIIMKTITLYHGEMINKEMAAKHFQTFKKNENIEFDKMKKFSLPRDVELVKLLNKARTSTEIPLLMEITLTNQLGVVDIGRAINEDKSFYVVRRQFQFVLDYIHKEKIHGQNVLLIKMHDETDPTETRMVQMANRLHELYSMDTKFFSDVN
ncbi:uncharacterized protein LOC127277576 [Leptopilina boulardi]|uniref:uncharacterized protein LOC127277576 n=1 Tax=Leptopilina boulardi TaxID=63433 RepID=UPI0021F51ED8|nr:uncharacterized protein LOC127277576 [Leptopilina boulardi]